MVTQRGQKARPVLVGWACKIMNVFPDWGQFTHSVSPSLGGTALSSQPFGVTEGQPRGEIMKTVHIHHDGQYWRGFRHGILAVALVGLGLALFSGSNQQALSQSQPAKCPDGMTFRGIQGSLVLCEAQPINSHRAIQPMPAWWVAFPEAGRLSGDTLQELDRYGLRPLSSTKAASCL
jgi:hypothetical protein